MSEYEHYESSVVGTLLSDAELELETPGGSSVAFSDLYRTYSGRVLAYARYLTDDEHEAEDLTQEAFWILSKKITKIQYPRGLLKWLRTVTRNQFLNSLRRKRVSISEDIEPIDSRDYLLHRIYELDLEDRFKLLSPEQKRIIEMHHLSGATHAEISEDNPSEVNQSKGQAFRGRAILKKSLGEDYLSDR